MGVCVGFGVLVALTVGTAVGVAVTIVIIEEELVGVASGRTAFVVITRCNGSLSSETF
jgi:hypothetical protein